MANPYENPKDAQKQRLAMRRQALEDDSTDAFFEIKKAKPQPPDLLDQVVEGDWEAFDQ
jgi:hypothetical protein